MSAGSRRGFLRSLVSLPLIGGGVTLIGAPTAVAMPCTVAALETYRDWLATEYGEALIELEPLTHSQRPYYSEHVARFRRDWCADNRTLNPFPSSGRFLTPPAEPPSARAAIVLSAVGCDWR